MDNKNNYTGLIYHVTCTNMVSSNLKQVHALNAGFNFACQCKVPEVT